MNLTLDERRPDAKDVEPERSRWFDENRQGIDYDEMANVQGLHARIACEQSEPRITIKPFSLWVLIVCGLAIFFTGFFWSRSGRSFSSAALSAGNPLQSESSRRTLSAPANDTNTVARAAAEANAPAVVRIIIKNMKFNPPSVEVKSGDAVEWKNEDITPHTATSAPLFDSRSIDPDKSWKHTFTEVGNFPYTCTFHPDMKAVVTVKQ